METIISNYNVKRLTETEQKNINGGTNLGYLFGIYTVATLATLYPLYGNAYYSYEITKRFL